MTFKKRVPDSPKVLLTHKVTQTENSNPIFEELPLLVKNEWSRRGQGRVS